MFPKSPALNRDEPLATPGGRLVSAGETPPERDGSSVPTGETPPEGESCPVQTGEPLVPVKNRLVPAGEPSVPVKSSPVPASEPPVEVNGPPVPTGKPSVPVKRPLVPTGKPPGEVNGGLVHQENGVSQAGRDADAPRDLWDHSRMKNMEPIRDPKILARATAAFDLCQTAENIMRQNLRRRHPQASEAEIRGRFVAWLEKRPYTEPPDSKA